MYKIRALNYLSFRNVSEFFIKEVINLKQYLIIS